MGSNWPSSRSLPTGPEGEQHAAIQCSNTRCSWQVWRPDFISSSSNMVDGHTNDAMVFLLRVPQDQNTRFQDGCLESQTSGCSKETVPPFSRAIGQSINSPGTPSGGIRTKSGSFRLIGSPVLNGCCTSPNCSFVSMTAHRL